MPRKKKDTQEKPKRETKKKKDTSTKKVLVEKVEEATKKEVQEVEEVKEPQQQQEEQPEKAETTGVQSDLEQPKPKKLKKGFLSGTGRRKTAVARVFLWQDKGGFTVNDKDISEYFPGEAAEIQWVKPFHIVGVSHPKAKYSASIKVEGSGKSSQLDAVVLAISKALAEINEEFRSSLAKQGLLTRDPRMVERKKYFLKKARKRPQYSKR